MIKKKTINQEIFDAHLFRLRDVLDVVPMTAKQREDVLYIIYDIEEEFKKVNK